MYVSIEGFLKYGSIGEVVVGMSRGAVLSLISEPAGYYRGKNINDAELWVNGPLIIWFKDNLVDQLGLYFQTDYESNRNISFVEWFPRKDTTIVEISEYMDEHRINFSKSGKDLITKSGTVITCSGESLNSVIYPDITKRLKKNA